MIVQYVAEDGQIFSTAESCEAYEKRLENFKKSNCKDYIICIKKYEASEELILVEDPCEADFIVLTENVSKNKVIEYLDYFDCVYEGLDGKKGIYAWDDYEWVAVTDALDNLENQIEKLQEKINDYNKIVDKIYDIISELIS